MTDYQQRKYDIIVFGATGFTGALTAEYIAGLSDKSLKWALAGRSISKLENVRDSLVEIDSSLKSLDLLIANSDNLESLDKLLAQTRVVISTVGPFMKYGTPLVEACIRQKTHYVDITGEHPWMKQIIDNFDDKAKQGNVLIVPGCGFDSVPSDLGVFVLNEHMQKQNLHLSDVKCSVVDMRGTVSGGTIQSFLGAATSGGTATLDPYLLATRRGVDKGGLPCLKKDHDFNGYWQGFFGMSPVNEKVVRRSWSIWADRGKTYGNTFSYKEYQSFGFITGVGYTFLLYTALPLVILLSGLPVIGKGFMSLLPGSGYGPTREQLKKGGYEFQFVGTSESEPYDNPIRARATVIGYRDPGYSDTCRMLTESALCIVKSLDSLPGKDGGILTPATAFGNVLVDRLRADGGMLLKAENME
ncbi:saccharopine dehydrogenase [Sporodiniella umbellata]|nr:saccharopine dehydrogenase [Sporodiniella umbellata]